jgi:putative transposase
LDYVHFNPVKHGVVTHTAAWRFSTFQRCVALGLYDEAWCGEDGNMSSGIGERR